MGGSLKADELASLCPEVYHMAEAGSWPGIVAYGLLSTTALLDLYGIVGDERDAILTRRRPGKVKIEGKGLPDAFVRDQIPIDDAKLASCLVGGMRKDEWYREINSKVFFWPDSVRLMWMMGAPAYIRNEHLVITIPTKTLVDRYADQVTISSINSGSTYPTGPMREVAKRGPHTFQALSTFQGRKITEIAVDDRVEDVRHLVAKAEIMVCRKKDTSPELVRTIWSRP